MEENLTIRQLTDRTAAVTTAIKLVNIVLSDQRFIAEIISKIEAMMWPDNLFGQMKESLERRDYEQIESILLEWEKTREVDLPAIRDRMVQTATYIEGFVKMFKKTNGNIDER